MVRMWKSGFGGVNAIKMNRIEIGAEVVFLFSFFDDFSFFCSGKACFLWD